MKYMGSKRLMLQNGLDKIIEKRMCGTDRFVDLFCGSSIVSWYVSRKHPVPVLANDLQEFCRVLAASVVCRTFSLGTRWIDSWLDRATSAAQRDTLFDLANFLQCDHSRTVSQITDDARSLCDKATSPITAAYGGYYFSPLQAIYLDYLRASVPRTQAYRLVAIGALVATASVCAAAPGHTAQPFQPTESAGPYLKQAWSRNILDYAKRHSVALSGYSAREHGRALRTDANDLAAELREGDLVFIDPPYSAVQYSRFYHVLETVANGERIDVSGTGRYPPTDLRPRSNYSMASQSLEIISELLSTIRTRKSNVLITYPVELTSNGISGNQIVDVAKQWFNVEYTTLDSHFSTLGGNTRNRSARKSSREMIMYLAPK